MNLRLLGTMLTVCLLAAGCRQDPRNYAYYESLRAESLAWEDRYFTLLNEHETTLEQLESYRSGETPQSKSGDKPAATKPSIRLPSTTPSPRVTPPTRKPDNGELDLTVPEIEFGTPTDPDKLVPPKRPATGSIPAQPSSLPIPLGGSAFGDPADDHSQPIVVEPPEAVEPPEPLDSHVTHIVLNPYLTAGHDFDRKPGDDGISLVIEPRNADDRFVPAAGEVSVVILDPALEGEAARVARWDFDIDEVSRRLKTASSRERGINLKLPWPGDPPQHSKLHIFVRFLSDEGQQLETDTELFVTLPGQFSNRWTPKLSTPLRPMEIGNPKGLARQFTGNAPDDNQRPPSVLPPIPASRNYVEPPSAKASTASAERPEWKPYR